VYTADRAEEVTVTVAVFNSILVASQLEQAVIDLLVKWMPTYLREVERQVGIEVNSTPIPEHYSNRNSFDVLPGEKFPKIVAISPGLGNPPISNGTGQYRAVWRMGVGAAIAADSEPLANQWAKIYGAAIRAIMINYPSLGGLAEAVRWEDELYEDIPIPNQNQLFKSAGVFFTIDCNNVVTRWSGPETPDEDPYAYGIVERVIIDLEKVDIDAEI
jgi:hypothetical protein